MADALVQVVENRVRVSVTGSHLLTPLIAAATAAANDANASAEAAAAAAAILSPYITAPDPDLHYARLVKIEFLEKDAAGVTVTLPAEPTVRELGSDQAGAEKRFRLRIAAHSSGSYTAFAKEQGNGTYRDTAGYTGQHEIPLVRNAGGEIIGYATVDFRSGSVIGDYTTTIAYSAGGLIAAKLRRSAAVIADTGNQIVDVVTEELATGAVFNDTVTDDYLKRLIRSAKPAYGDPGTSYIPNYEMVDNGVENAGPSRYRVSFKPYDPVRGKDIGLWTLSSASDLLSVIPEQIFITQAANGNINPKFDPDNVSHNPLTDTYYTGEVVTITIDRSVLEYGHVMTTYTDPADAGIKPEHVITNNELDLVIDHAPRPSRQIYIAASGADATSFQAAFDADYMDGLTVGRASFPLSDLNTPTHPTLYEVAEDGYDEEVSPTVVEGLDTGLVVPHFSIIRGRGGRLWIDDASTAPVLELNRSGTLEDLIIEQLGTTNGGYGIHSDGAGKLTIPAMEGLPILRYRDRTILRRVTIITHSTHPAGACAGMGFGNGQRVLFDECRFVRVGGGAAAEIICHSSPDTTVAGLIHFRNCAGNFAIELNKSHAMDVQHRVIVENCEVRKIASNNTAGGNAGFVRQGRFDGLTAAGTVVDGTYSNLLDDYA